MTPHQPLPRRAAALVAFAAATSLVAACGSSEATQVTSAGPTTTTASAARGVQVTGAWARNSPKVASAGAVFLTIENAGDTDDALVGVHVDAAVAARAEVHETVVVADDEGAASGGMGSETPPDGGAMDPGASAPMMTMRPVDRIAVVAGTTVALEPGGYHVMLLDLVAPLQVGQEVRITLVFEEAGEVDVVAEVRDLMDA